MRNVWPRILQALSIGRLTANTDESAATQRMQIEFPGGVVRDKLFSLQFYGLASRPLPGADLVMVSVAGDSTRGVIVASNDQRYRPTDLQPGEVCMSNHTGSRVTLHADGSMSLSPSSGVVNVAGKIVATGDVVAGSVSLQQHVHTGVQAGQGLTGAPKQ